MLLREEIQRQHELVLRLLESGKPTQSDGSTISNFIDALGKMQAFAPKAPDLAGVVDLMRFAKETITSTADSGSWSSVVDNLIKAVPTIIGGMAQMKKSESPNVKELSPQDRVLASEQAELALLKQAIERLKLEQRSGMPSGLVVDWISNHMEDASYRNVAEVLLNRPFENLFRQRRNRKRTVAKLVLRVYTDLRKALIDDQTPDNGSSPNAGAVGIRAKP